MKKHSCEKDGHYPVVHIESNQTNVVLMDKKFKKKYRRWKRIWQCHNCLKEFFDYVYEEE